MFHVSSMRQNSFNLFASNMGEQRIKFKEKRNQMDSLAQVICDWQRACPAEPPTANMLQWMAAWPTKCPLVCCRATDCATIQCAFCHVSLTSAIGTCKLRYECTECAPVACESFTTGQRHVVSATTMCETCFVWEGTGRAPHRHADRFLRIAPLSGQHTAVARPAPCAAMRGLLLADFPLILGVVAGECCCACCDTFSAENPAVGQPFCTERHGVCGFDLRRGPFDSRCFLCGPCALRDAEARSNLAYDNPSAFCRVCVHQRAMEQFRLEFTGDRAAALASAGNGQMDEGATAVAECHRLLMSIHKQPWIRDIVSEVFGLESTE